MGCEHCDLNRRIYKATQRWRGHVLPATFACGLLRLGSQLMNGAWECPSKDFPSGTTSERVPGRTSMDCLTRVLGE